MEKLHRSIFLKEVKSAFPQLRDKLNAEYGLLHLEMHVFADFAQRCIFDGDVKQTRVCLMIAEKYCKGGNADMRNAIDVSFVEHLDLRQAPWAWDLLGPCLRDFYRHCIAIGTVAPLPYLTESSR